MGDRVYQGGGEVGSDVTFCKNYTCAQFQFSKVSEVWNLGFETIKHLYFLTRPIWTRLGARNIKSIQGRKLEES